MSDKAIYVRTGKVIDDIREIGREHGYAVAVHGSLRETRDIDLIAAPWAREAHACSTLVRAIGALPYLSRRTDGKFAKPWPKPHGRLGFVFFVRYRAKGCPPYVDLSVMPRG